MTKTLSALIGVALALSVQSPATAKGRLLTLPMGTYHCALPGDATGERLVRRSDADFRILNGSSYRHVASAKMGTYLRTGDDVVFTRGPLKNVKLAVVGENLLRRVTKNGALGRMTCSRVAR